MRKKLFPIVLVMSVAAFIQTGCDKPRGCTDPYSDNFDPEATEDDDTCIPTRMKFVGDYDSYGTSYGMISVEDTALTSYDQVDVSLTDETANDPEQLILGISNFDQPIYALTTQVASTYKLNIITQTIGAFTYFGEASINGRVLELSYTRVEKIEIEPEVFEYDTLYLNIYGLQELE